MNAADLRTARRLIAEFEGRAQGRHNSTVDCHRPVMMGPTIDRPAEPAPRSRQASLRFSIDTSAFEAAMRKYAEAVQVILVEIKALKVTKRGAEL